MYFKKRNVSFHQSKKRDWNNYVLAYTLRKLYVVARFCFVKYKKDFSLLKQAYFSDPKAGGCINYKKNHRSTNTAPQRWLLVGS